MYPSRFDYIKVASFSEASAALVDGGSDAKLMAGGQTLIPMMKLRLLAPKLLIDLTGIQGADEVTLGDDLIEIGALTRHGVAGKSRRPRPLPSFRTARWASPTPRSATWARSAEASPRLILLRLLAGLADDALTP